MDAAKIIEARKYGRTFVAVGEIVEVKLSYVTDSLVRQKLDNKSRLVGRIESFFEDGFTLDCSELYNAKTYTIYNNIIIEIFIVPPKEAEYTTTTSVIEGGL